MKFSIIIQSFAHAKTLFYFNRRNIECKSNKDFVFPIDFCLSHTLKILNPFYAHQLISSIIWIMDVFRAANKRLLGHMRLAGGSLNMAALAEARKRRKKIEKLKQYKLKREID